MPEYMCVQCFACDTFQVQQVKKVDKFTCRLCQAPQSVRKASTTESMAGNGHVPPFLEGNGLFQMYAISTMAKDVRSVVVELNAKRAELDSAETKPQARPQPANPTQHQDSQWGSFVTQESAVSNCNDPEDPSGPEEFITSMPGKVQRKRKSPNELEHDVSDGHGSKKNVGGRVGLPQHHCTAPVSTKIQASSCPSKAVNVQQHKAAGRSCTDVQYGSLEKAERSSNLQPASLSATHGHGGHATLPPAATHISVPSREPLGNRQASKAESIGRSRSTWSSFLEHNDARPHASVAHDDGDVLSDDGDSIDLITAFD